MTTTVFPSPTLVRCAMDTPLGVMIAGATETHLVELGFASDGTAAAHRRAPDVEDHPVLSRVRAALADYFAGETHAFDDLPLAPQGSAFQRRVWAGLGRIPFGCTVCYGELAASIGHPGAARAVGNANRCNPMAIIIPCHRVVQHDGSLGGYAGGRDRKSWLLRHEDPSALRPGAAG